ncbi:MAG: hypothetical protein IJ752_05655 [Alphaproteobacteria bacterium]|nr:hypothetical protein [Alphaproteobacteria bacterium]
MLLRQQTKEPVKRIQCLTGSACRYGECLHKQKGKKEGYSPSAKGKVSGGVFCLTEPCLRFCRDRASLFAAASNRAYSQQHLLAEATAFPPLVQVTPEQ